MAAASVVLAARGVPDGGARTAALTVVPSRSALDRAVDRAVVPTQWCGSDVVAEDRKPDAVSGQYVHVVYAIPSDGGDRFTTVASAVATDIATVDEWWRAQDASRAPRFDLHEFPGCGSTFGRLDISTVRLSLSSAELRPLEGRLGRLAGALPSLDGNKKYVVFYDGPADSPNVCGQAYVAPDDGGTNGIAALWLGASGCSSDLGQGGFEAAATTHELIHSLGALPDSGPPHACPGDSGHPCDSTSDVIFPVSRGQGIAELTLDVGRDDYYGHSGSWWDVQDSPWLSRLDTPDHVLTVSITGAGSVASDKPGIECPPACSIAWESGSDVRLSVEPLQGTTFRGWGGACAGTGECVLKLDAPRSVTARFAVLVRLATRVVQRAGSGVITSVPAGIKCPPTCDAEFERGAAVQLRAKPARGARLVGWQGACSGGSACTVEAGGGPSGVTATFDAAAFRVAVQVTGRGRVTGSKGGLACPSRCSASIAAESTVRLTAAAAKGWRFTAWSGDCRGRGACVLRAESAHLVRATFRRA